MASSDSDPLGFLKTSRSGSSAANLASTGHRGGAASRLAVAMAAAGSPVEFPECLSQLLPNSSLPFKIQLKFLPPPERLLWVSIIPRNPKVRRGQTNAPLNKDVHTLIFKACKYTPLCGKINLAGMTK